MFNPSIYENSQPDGFAVLEIVDQPLADAPTARTRSFVPLQRTELRGMVLGPLANLCLTQIFCYDRRTYGGAIEARYRFPLPGDAAVTAVTVHFGTVEIVAALHARPAAEAVYATAKAAGHQAALATRESADLFTLQITGLQPDEPVTVETHYVQLARSDRRSALGDQPPAPQWSLRIPLTTAPRYVRSDEGDSRAAQGQPLALLRDPGHRFLLDLEFQGVTQVESPTHELVTVAAPAVADDQQAPKANGQGTTDRQPIRIQLAGGAVLPDRDCLLRWSPPQAVAASTLAVLTHHDEAQQRLYFLALVAPPLQRPSNVPAREVTLLVDHSGSMSGPKWAAADWAVERFLRDLQPTDAFALAMFHYQTRWFAEALQPAALAPVDQAVQWLHAQQDSGGTELGVALEQALHLPRSTAPATGEVARHLLIVTDAAVSDAARILRLADDEAKRSNRRRISVLCIDAAPNAFLANELAERGGGVARFLTSDPTQKDIVTALDEVLLEWGEPLLVNLQLTVNRPDVLVSGQQQQAVTSDGDRRTFIDLGDLAAGRAQWVVGALPVADQAALAEPLTFDLFAGQAAPQRLATQTLNRTDLAHTTAQATTTAALKALFGTRRVNALEYLMNANLADDQLAEQLTRLGYDAAAILSSSADRPSLVYAENQRRQHTDRLRPLLVQEALDYGLASAETAFIATRKEAGQPVTATVAVANALPAGWSGEFLAPSPAFSPGTSMLSSAAALPMPMASLAPTTDSASSRGLAQRLGQMMPTFGVQAQTPLHAAAGARGAGSATPRTYELFSGVPAANAVARSSTASSTAGSSTAGSSTAGSSTAGSSIIGDELVLFDSAATGDPLPAAVTLTGLTLRPQDDATADSLRQLAANHDLHFAIYIGDLLVPSATIRLRDLLRAAARPINLRRAGGAPVRVTLHDPTNLLQAHNVAFTLVVTAA